MKELISMSSEPLRSRSKPCELISKLGEGQLGQAQWIGSYLLEWEILIYERTHCWEACFFKWDGHHEHLKASSLNDACRQAKDRIEVLETTALKLRFARKGQAR